MSAAPGNTGASNAAAAAAAAPQPQPTMAIADVIRLLQAVSAASQPQPINGMRPVDPVVHLIGALQQHAQQPTQPQPQQQPQSASAWSNPPSPTAPAAAPPSAYGGGNAWGALLPPHPTVPTLAHQQSGTVSTGLSHSGSASGSGLSYTNALYGAGAGYAAAHSFVPATTGGSSSPPLLQPALVSSASYTHPPGRSSAAGGSANGGPAATPALLSAPLLMPPPLISSQSLSGPAAAAVAAASGTGAAAAPNTFYPSHPLAHGAAQSPPPLPYAAAHAPALPPPLQHQQQLPLPTASPPQQPLLSLQLPSAVALPALASPATPSPPGAPDPVVIGTPNPTTTIAPGMGPRDAYSLEVEAELRRKLFKAEAERDALEKALMRIKFRATARGLDAASVSALAHARKSLSGPAGAAAAANVHVVPPQYYAQSAYAPAPAPPPSSASPAAPPAATYVAVTGDAVGTYGAAAATPKTAAVLGGNAARATGAAPPGLDPVALAIAVASGGAEVATAGGNSSSGSNSSRSAATSTTASSTAALPPSTASPGPGLVQPRPQQPAAAVMSPPSAADADDSDGSDEETPVAVRSAVSAAAAARAAANTNPNLSRALMTPPAVSPAPAEAEATDGTGAAAGASDGSAMVTRMGSENMAAPTHGDHPVPLLSALTSPRRLADNRSGYAAALADSTISASASSTTGSTVSAGGSSASATVGSSTSSGSNANGSAKDVSQSQLQSQQTVIPPQTAPKPVPNAAALLRSPVRGHARAASFEVKLDGEWSSIDNGPTTHLNEPHAPLQPAAKPTQQPQPSQPAQPAPAGGGGTKPPAHPPALHPPSLPAKLPSESAIPIATTAVPPTPPTASHTALAAAQQPQKPALPPTITIPPDTRPTPPAGAAKPGQQSAAAAPVMLRAGTLAVPLSSGGGISAPGGHVATSASLATAPAAVTASSVAIGAPRLRNRKAAFKLIRANAQQVEEELCTDGRVRYICATNSFTRLQWVEPPQSILIIKKPREKEITKALVDLALWLHRRMHVQVWVEPSVAAEEAVLAASPMPPNGLSAGAAGQRNGIGIGIGGARGGLASGSRGGGMGGGARPSGAQHPEGGWLNTWSSDEHFQRISKTIDFVVCLGGDGTLLWVSSLFKTAVPPIISFAMGSLGFLTPFAFEHFKDSIMRVFRGNFTLSLRSRLMCQIIRQNQDPDTPSPDALPATAAAAAAGALHPPMPAVAAASPQTKALVHKHLPGCPLYVPPVSLTAAPSSAAAPAAAGSGDASALAKSLSALAAAAPAAVAASAAAPELKQQPRTATAGGGSPGMVKALSSPPATSGATSSSTAGADAAGPSQSAPSASSHHQDAANANSANANSTALAVTGGTSTAAALAAAATLSLQCTCPGHTFAGVDGHSIHKLPLVASQGPGGPLVPVAVQPPKPCTFQCLNEVILDRGPSTYLTNLDCFVDGMFFTKVQADGIIIGTPTGSTAYSLSAGGSMVHPEVPAILFTPVCPHSLSFRPLLFPDSSELRICVSPDSRVGACVSFDGQNRHTLMQGDALSVQMSQWPLPVICCIDETTDWFDGVRGVLMWNSRTTQKPMSTTTSSAAAAAVAAHANAAAHRQA